MTKIINISIDGPAASGKGTLAQNLAAHYDFACLQTGLLYRALAAEVLKRGGGGGGAGDDVAFALDVAKNMENMEWAKSRRENLHTPQISETSSILAAHPEIRALLLAYQRDFAAHPPGGKKGAILDGRDIGTVVLPDADVKFYLTASPEARVTRRQKQFSQKQPQNIEQEIRARDRRDQERAASPLVPAPDAHLLDTTKLSIEATYSQAVKIIGDVCAAQGINI